MTVEQALDEARDAIEFAPDNHVPGAFISKQDTVVRIETLQKLIDIAEDWKSMVGPLTAM